jgi:transcriptional regulator with XRE-family HTH domain
MIVGERLRTLREERNFSQGEIEKRTGLLRCYISRVENGHTVPAVETLEKFARALEVPLYQLMYDGEKPPQLANLKRKVVNLLGAAQEKTLECSGNFASSWEKQMRVTSNCFFPLPTKWQGKGAIEG